MPGSLIRNLTVMLLLMAPLVLKAEKAIFAGGCFWCVEALYQELEGVSDAVSGFTGGTLKNPTYDGDHTGHYEAVLVTYDPDLVSYDELLALFWVNIDPFNNNGQFCDHGPSYRSAIFYNSEAELSLAQTTRQAIVERHGSEVFTEILPVTEFYPVQAYHQDYYKKNPLRYRLYRSGCRRDARLQKIWGERTRH